jgi:hypothetical protein
MLNSKMTKQNSKVKKNKGITNYANKMNVFLTRNSKPKTQNPKHVRGVLLGGKC